MRAKEFITDQTGPIDGDVAAALPMTYAIPKLQNQDAYKQYRFGVAIAKAKGRKHAEHLPPPTENPWGENQVVIGFGNTLDEYIDDALKDVGLSPSDKKMITTPASEESSSVSKKSPVANIKKNRYGI